MGLNLGRFTGPVNARHASIFAASTLLFAIVFISTTSAVSPSVTDITIDGSQAGPAFQGVGAISGGGGNSRYLIDYPEPERSQILNYLFKPDYGANIQLLKLEIGGDANSTDGAEPSIEHTQGQLDCNSGYEWWLAEQAVARNPNIKLYGLQWAAPGWVGNGNQTLWTHKDVNYVVDWLNCAKSHNLSISYIGGWNEASYDANWTKNLRTALNLHGYGNVQILLSDQDPTTDWAVANAMASDSSFDAAVSVVGEHNPCQAPTTGFVCTTTPTARSLGKPLWASELGAMDSNGGAAAMVRSINNGYIQAGLTGFLEWPLVNSIAPGLPFENRGLITADQPWSGNYSVNKMMWAIAQTTQFVDQGWLHVGGANKTIGNSGTYNTYQKPDHSAWSMVAENTSSYAGQQVLPQTVKVSVKGGLNASTVHVWETNLWSNNASGWFVHQADILPSDGTFSYTIPAGYVVTFTTTSGQSKGAGSQLPNKIMQLPFTATPDGSNEPVDFSPMDGAFVYTNCQGGITGECIQQMAPETPVYWSHSTHEPRFPYGIVGDKHWGNYNVTTDALFETAGSTAGVIGRYGNQSSNVGDIERFDGYELTLNDSGSWNLYKNSNGSGRTTLESGIIAPPGLHSWHTISLDMLNGTITGIIDGQTVSTIADTSYGSGLAGIESSWTNVQFKNFSVNPLTTTGPIKSGIDGKCLDDYGNGTDDLTKVDIFTCNDGAAQNWTISSTGTIEINGKCLDAYQGGVANGTKTDLFSCNGTGAQQWISNGAALVNPESGKCLDDPSFSTVNNTQLDLWTCNGGINQVWYLPS